jgi:TP901 family phage tail tape measure protein
MADKKQIEWEIRLKDLASKILKEFGTNAKKEAKKADSAFSKLGKSLGGMVGTFGKIAAGVGVAAVAFKAFNAVTSRLSRGVEDAIAFSRAMAEVSTISEDVAARLGGVTDQVLDLSTKFGLLETDAAKALYQTISAGVTDTTQAMELLDGAVTLSRGGLADLTSTIDLLTNTINAYGMSVDDVEHINNVFFETVRLGKTTITNLADSMGVATPIAASLGVSIEELSAMLAALTKGGVDTTTAVIYVRQALNSILKPSADAQKLMEANSISFDAATVKADGFIGILNELKVKLGDNIESWQKFFPNVRAFIPVLALAGNQFEEFRSILDSLTSTALDKAQPAMRALERVMLSAGEKITVLRNAARQGFTEVGLAIIEGFTGPIQTVEELQAGATTLRGAIGDLAPAFKALVGMLAILASLLPNLIQLFVQMAKEAQLPGFERGNVQLERAAERLGLVGDAMREMGQSLISGEQVQLSVFSNLAESMKAHRRSIIDNIADLEKQRDVLEDNGAAFEDLRKKLGKFATTAGRRRFYTAEQEAMISSAFAGLKDIDLETFGIFLNLDDEIVQQLEQVFVDAGIKSRDISRIAYKIPEELFNELFRGLEPRRYQNRLKNAESQLVKQYKEFVLETGREFQGVQEELDALVGPEKQKEIQETLDRTLGMGVEVGPEAEAAAKRAQAIQEVTQAIREYGLELEELKYRADDSAAAQIAAIQLTTKEAQANLKKRLLSNEEGVTLSKERYDSLYAALEEGEKRQIELVKKRSLQESQAAAKALADERRRLEAFRERAREEQMAALMQPFEDVEAFVTVTPEMQLESLKASLDGAQQRLRELKELNLQSVLTGGEPIVTPEQMAQLEALIANVKEYEMAALQAEINTEEMKKRFEELPEGIQGAALALGEFIDANLDMKQVMQDFTRNFLDGFSNLLTDTFSAIATGAKTAKEAWADFGKQFVLMIVQMATQLAVMLSLALVLKAVAPGLAEFMFGAEALSAVGLKDGGIVSGGTGEMHALANGGVVLGGLGRATPVRGYANGGPIVSGPHVALIGEGKHNEAVVPLPDGRSIPVDMRGGGDAGQNINVNINAVDAKGIDQLLVDRSSTLRDIIRQALNEDRLFRNQVASVR